MAITFTNMYVDSAQGTTTGHAGTIGDPYSLQDLVNNYVADFAAMGATSTRLVYHMTGTFNFLADIGTDTLTLSGVSGTRTKAMQFRAFGSTPGDGGLITCTGIVVAGDGKLFEGWDIAHNFYNNTIMNVPNGCTLYRCRVVNTNPTRGTAVRLEDSNMSYCYVDNQNDSSVSTGYAVNFATNSRLQNNLMLSKSWGLVVPGNNSCNNVNNTFIHTGSSGNSFIGADHQGNHQSFAHQNNRYHNWGTAVEINASTGNNPLWSIHNNVFNDCDVCVETAVDSYGEAFGVVSNNHYNNATTFLSGNFAFEENNNALTGDPFTDSANGDLSLNNTAGAGAVCRANGIAVNLPYDYTNMLPLAVYDGAIPTGIASDLGFGY